MDAASTLECLDENRALAFVEHELGPGERGRSEAHLDGCAACRRLVSELARSLAPASAHPAVLGRGATLGRYVLLDVLGAGAMGVVYAAFDPELDRKIALKLLQAGGGEGALLVREARAMARLSHPNVVRVYDAGAEAGRYFFVMELVEGASLAAHLRRRAPDTREVLSLFVKAGRGLEAAHRAGLVHRDFKPDNVMVGRAGEVRVTDFGLAHRAAPGATPRGAEGAAPGAGQGPRALAAGVTAAFAGTPAYMAPEQLRGERADARSDQFSFCVALYEALYGAKPFEGASTDALLEAIEAGARRRSSARGAAPLQGAAPARGTVPVRARRAIERGLSADPARRFGSMGELLEVLSPERARRTLWVAGLGVLLAAPALALGAQRARHEATCARGRAEVGQVWGEARKERVRQAFEATGLPFAARAARAAAAMLDRQAAAIGAMRVEACRAAGPRGGQPAERYEPRAQCLDARLGELDALASELERPDAGVVERAVPASLGLKAVAPCADAAPLPAALRPTESQLARLGGVRKLLAEARALYVVGRLPSAVEAARRALEGAEAVGHAPARAEALVQLGEYELWGGGPDNDRRLVDAFRAAELAHDDRLKARAAAALAFFSAQRLQQFERGLDWADLALAALDRAGGDDAIASIVYNNRTSALLLSGRRDEAAASLERSIELAERAGLGEWALASRLTNLASVRRDQGRYEQAEALYRRALGVYLETNGPSFPGVGLLLNALAFNREAAGDYAGARSHFEQGLDGLRGAYGPDRLEAIRAAFDLADFDLRQGRPREALAPLGDALARSERALGPGDPTSACARAAYGRALFETGRAGEGLDAMARAVADLEARLGPSTGMLVRPLTFLAAAELARGRAPAARAHALRALGLEPTRALLPDERAELALAAARAFETADPAKACAFASDAREAYRKARPEPRPPGASPSAPEAALDAWLAAHGGPCPSHSPERPSAP